MRKATIETAQLILVVAIAIVGLIFVAYTVNEAWDVGCKRVQMDEFGKIWRELRYWESREDVAPVGYNIVPNFYVKSCVSKITYYKDEDDEEKLKVEWKDGAEEDMPAFGEWLFCELKPSEESYKVKVSLRRVEFPDWEEC